MSDCRIVFDVPTGERIWINPRQIIKMVRNTMGRYFIFMTNGETYEISHGTACQIEDFFQDV